MGRVRSFAAAAVDRAIGGLEAIRDRIATGSGADGPASGTGADGDPATDTGTTELDTADGNGDPGAVRRTLARGLEYQKTALRHPLAAQRAHLAALRETPVLSTAFLREATLSGASIKRDRTERIREFVDSERTLRDDVREVARGVDWRQTWRYGKYGYLAGRRYRGRLPVADEYAPVAGALAGGAVGAASGVTDRQLVDVDPDRLFDRIDAVSSLRDDPVARARVARETLAAVERRYGTDDLPLEDVLDDDAIAELVTREDEAVPDEIPRGTHGGESVLNLVWGDPHPDRGTDPALPPGTPDDDLGPDRQADSTVDLDPGAGGASAPGGGTDPDDGDREPDTSIADE